MNVMSKPSLLLSRSDLVSLVRRVGLDTLMDLTIARLEEALAHAPPWTDDLPPRAGFPGDRERRSLLEWMPYRAADGHTTIKIVSYAPHNPARHGMPTILGNVAAYEIETGHLAVLADGVFLTALRTGAASAVATRILARPDSRVLGLVGAGAQAITQLHGISRVVPLKKVVVHDVDPSRAASFAGRCAHFAGHLDVVVATADRVAREADVITTATSVGVGEGPVLLDEGLRPHVHVNAVGSDMPGKFELPIGLLERSFVCADFVSQALVEGECQQLGRVVGPDLRELVQGRDVFARRALETTVFDSTGFAFEDHVALQLLRDLATDLGVGTFVEVEAASRDPLDPYAFTRSAGAARDASETSHAVTPRPRDHA